MKSSSNMEASFKHVAASTNLNAAMVAPNNNNNSGSNVNNSNFNHNSAGKNYHDYQDRMLSDETKQLMEMFNRMLITMHVTYKIDTKFYPRGGTYEIVVMHQPDANFLFGLIKSEENKSKMMEIVQRLSSAARNPIQLSDSFCFALLDNSPCRAYIISRDARKARLFFLDWGNIDNVDLGKCYKIKDEPMKICPLCMPFELRGCPCNTKPPPLEQPITLRAEIRCINGPRRTILVNAFYNDKPYSDLFTTSLETNNNMEYPTSPMTASGGGGETVVNRQNNNAPGFGQSDLTKDLNSLTLGPDFHLPVIEKGSTIKLKIVSVITPSSFIFQTTDDYFQKAIKSSINQLKSVIAKGHHQLGAINRESFIAQTLKAGHTVVVCNDKLLSRAHVLKVIHGLPSSTAPTPTAGVVTSSSGGNNTTTTNSNRSKTPAVESQKSANGGGGDKAAISNSTSTTMLEIILLETGEKCIITTDCVYPCPKDLRNIPGLFYKGCLNNIKPIGGMSWDARATRLFASMVENIELEAKIVHVGRLANKPVSVHFMDLFLFDDKNKEGVNTRNSSSNNPQTNLHNNNNNSNHDTASNNINHTSVAEILVNSRVSVTFRSS